MTARLIACALILLLAGPAYGQKNLAMACGSNEADATACPVTRSWVRPTSTDSVAACMPGVALTECSYGKPGLRFYPWGQLPSTSWVWSCSIDIPAGPFGTPLAEVNCPDPCGCGGPGDRKTFVLKSQLEPPPGGVGTMALTWGPVTQDTSGKAIAVTGYRIEWGTSATVLTQTITLGAVTTYTITDLPPGTYYGTVRALAGNSESDRSNLFSKTIAAIPAAKPRPPVVSVVENVAYDLVKSTNALTAKAIGTVPVGTPCDTSQRVLDDYFVVPRTAAKLTSASRPLVVLAKCN